MTYETWIVLGFAVATVVLLALLVWQRRPANVAEAQAALTEAATLARIAVAAAEQLHRTGRLPDNDAKFDYALNLVATQFPGLDADQLTATIEAAVYWLRRAPWPAAAGASNGQPAAAQGLPRRGGDR